MEMLVFGGIVEARDPHGNATQGALTITVTDVDPTSVSDNDGSTNEGAEDASAGDPVGVTGSSSEPGGTITYSLTDSAGGRFQIDSSTGVVPVASAPSIDHESSGSHTITIQAENGEGTTASDSFSIGVTDVAPDQPTDTDAAANQVAEDAGNGAAVGVTAGASDPGGGTVTYTLTDDAGGRFQVDGGTGDVSVADASKIDFESAASHTVTLAAKDTDGTTSASKTFTIDVTSPPATISRTSTKTPASATASRPPPTSRTAPSTARPAPPAKPSTRAACR